MILLVDRDKKGGGVFRYALPTERGCKRSGFPFGQGLPGRSWGFWENIIPEAAS